MELTDQQYEQLKALLPRQRGNVKGDNQTVLATIRSRGEQGCKWRGLPERFSNWLRSLRRRIAGLRAASCVGVGGRCRGVARALTCCERSEEGGIEKWQTTKATTKIKTTSTQIRTGPNLLTSRPFCYSPRRGSALRVKGGKERGGQISDGRRRYPYSARAR